LFCWECYNDHWACECGPIVVWQYLRYNNTLTPKEDESTPLVVDRLFCHELFTAEFENPPNPNGRPAEWKRIVCWKGKVCVLCEGTAVLSWKKGGWGLFAPWDLHHSGLLNLNKYYPFRLHPPLSLSPSPRGPILDEEWILNEPLKVFSLLSIILLKIPRCSLLQKYTICT
jgi:hypothetical protein